MKYTSRRLILWLALILAAPSHACDCVDNPKLPKRPLVFVGTALEDGMVDVPASDGSIKYYYKYSFRVSRRIVGHVGTQVFVYTTRSNCRSTFEAGRRYKIVAGQFANSGRWYTDICFGNQKLRSKK